MRFLSFYRSNQSIVLEMSLYQPVTSLVPVVHSLFDKTKDGGRQFQWTRSERRTPILSTVERSPRVHIIPESWVSQGRSGEGRLGRISGEGRMNVLTE